MGNSISNTNLRPQRLIECLNRDGEFDLDLYALYLMHKRNQEDEDNETLFRLATEACRKETEETSARPNKKRKRSVKKNGFEIRDPSTGVWKQATPEISEWYIVYVKSPQTNKPRCGNFVL